LPKSGEPRSLSDDEVSNTNVAVGRATASVDGRLARASRSFKRLDDKTTRTASQSPSKRAILVIPDW